MEPDRVGAAIFESFFLYWGLRAAAERFDPDQAAVLGTAMAGLSLSLLGGDEHGWFDGGDREGAIVEAMNTAARRPAVQAGRRHERVDVGRGPHGEAGPSSHVARGGIRDAEQGRRPPFAAAASPVCNTGFDPTYLAAVGANYRINAELCRRSARPLGRRHGGPVRETPAAQITATSSVRGWPGSIIICRSTGIGWRSGCRPD